LTTRVYKILEGKKEAERVLYKSDGEEGFLVLPDLKWDQTSMLAMVSDDLLCALLLI
jgi:m7GpppX diphosphatase